MQLEAGTLIGGRYRLDRQLGRGGMGEVWAAKHTVTRRDVALKFLTVEEGALPQMHRRFLREARAASAVSHPNVIQIQDVFELEDGTPVMVMDLLSGEALADRLAREGSLPVEVAARLLAPVVSAVGTAHAAGIVHRDLKPENIFLARTGDGEIEVKVLDFGIAKLGSSLESDGAGNITGTGAVLGTPYYMALEQAYGEKDIDHRADIWALGVILYECLAGVRPIVGDNFGQIVKHLTHGQIPPLIEIAPHVPVELSLIVGKMLSRAREDRPADLREVLPVLRRYTGAQVRTFGEPRAPLGATPEGGVARVDPGRAQPLGDTRVSAIAPETTIEVVTLVPRPKGSDPDRLAPPAASSPRPTPAKLQISTGKKASPGDVTLADSAAAVPPAPPPATAHRTGVIAAAGVFAGIVATAVVVAAMRPPVPQPQAPGGSAPVESARAAGTATVSAPPAVPVPPSTITPEPSASASVAPTGPTVRRPGPMPSSSARAPVTTATVTRPVAGTPTARNGGLVDDPPF